MESREDQISRESGILRAFQRQADEIARLIVATDLPWIDIEIKVEQLRREAERLYPRKSALFEMIYLRRFQRLREQWRG
jgi:hypothetical protein